MAEAPKKPRVELFDCTLRHGGNKEHEIQKIAVTGRELLLMRSMHGEEAIPESSIKPHRDSKTGEPATREISAQHELFELARKYGNTANPISGKKLVEKVFGQPLVGFEQWLEDAVELERMEQEEAHKRRNLDMQKRRQEAATQAAS